MTSTKQFADSYSDSVRLPSLKSCMKEGMRMINQGNKVEKHSQRMSISEKYTTFVNDKQLYKIMCKPIVKKSNNHGKKSNYFSKISNKLTKMENKSTVPYGMVLNTI